MHLEQSFNLQEPEIHKEEIFIVKEKNFHQENVAIVTGASSGVGRAVAVALAVNGLSVLGADIGENGGKESVEIARRFGGKIIFQKTDLTKDEDIVNCVEIAAEYGTIKFLANIAGIKHIGPIENFPMEIYDLM